MVYLFKVSTIELWIVIHMNVKVSTRAVMVASRVRTQQTKSNTSTGARIAVATVSLFDAGDADDGVGDGVGVAVGLVVVVDDCVNSMPPRKLHAVSLSQRKNTRLKRSQKMCHVDHMPRANFYYSVRSLQVV